MSETEWKKFTLEKPDGWEIWVYIPATGSTTYVHRYNEDDIATYRTKNALFTTAFPPPPPERHECKTAFLYCWEDKGSLYVRLKKNLLDNTKEDDFQATFCPICGYDP